MTMQTITFRIYPTIKNQFQREIFQFRFGNMSNLLRKALTELSEKGLGVANKYIFGARTLQKMSRLSIDEAEKQVGYSVKIDASLKQKLDQQLKADTQLKKFVKSISYYCRCVCEYYVYSMTEHSQIGAPQLLKNPVTVNGVVHYKMIFRNHFDKHTMDIFIPGLPADKFMFMDIKLPDAQSALEILISTIVNDYISPRLLELIQALPKGTYPKENNLTGVTLGDNCDMHDIAFDLNKMWMHIDDDKVEVKNQVEAISINFSAENAKYLSELNNRDQVLNELMNHYRKHHPKK